MYKGMDKFLHLKKLKHGKINQILNTKEGIQLTELFHEVSTQALTNS